MHIESTRANKSLNYVDKTVKKHISAQDRVPLFFRKEGRKEMFYLMMHSTHFIYGYTASDIW